MSLYLVWRLALAFWPVSLLTLWLLAAAWLVRQSPEMDDDNPAQWRWRR